MASNHQLLLSNVSSEILETITKSRYLFYLPNPYETMFPSVNLVPRYITQVCLHSIYILIYMSKWMIDYNHHQVKVKMPTICFIMFQ